MIGEAWLGRVEKRQGRLRLSGILGQQHDPAADALDHQVGRVPTFGHRLQGFVAFSDLGRREALQIRFMHPGGLDQTAKARGRVGEGGQIVGSHLRKGRVQDPKNTLQLADRLDVVGAP